MLPRDRRSDERLQLEARLPPALRISRARAADGPTDCHFQHCLDYLTREGSFVRFPLWGV
jgi:hypothetical protein